VGINIPAGIQNGARLRLASQGEIGEGGGNAGDLYVDISVRADKAFTRDGDDLHCWISIPMSWAALGHSTTVTTFDGDQQLAIPSGSQPDDVIPIKGFGGVKLHSGTERGDLYIHLQVEIPTKLSDSERETLEKFSASRQDDSVKVEQQARAIQPRQKGFFGKLKDAFS
jgi:molecular chaperone DnaJ